MRVRGVPEEPPVFRVGVGDGFRQLLGNKPAEATWRSDASALVHWIDVQEAAQILFWGDLNIQIHHRFWDPVTIGYCFQLLTVTVLLQLIPRQGDTSVIYYFMRKDYNI